MDTSDVPLPPPSPVQAASKAAAAHCVPIQGPVGTLAWELGIYLLSLVPACQGSLGKASPPIFCLPCDFNQSPSSPCSADEVKSMLTLLFRKAMKPGVAEPIVPSRASKFSLSVQVARSGRRHCPSIVLWMLFLKCSRKLL